MPSCAVFKCSNRFSQGKRLFQIPSNPVLFKKWETFLIKSGTKYISKYSKVCEDHFTFTFCNDIPLRNKVPTIYISKSSIASINPKDKKNLLQKNRESMSTMCRICLFDATESWVSINSSSKALDSLSVREVVYNCFNIQVRT
jgi:THAP domain